MSQPKYFIYRRKIYPLMYVLEVRKPWKIKGGKAFIAKGSLKIFIVVIYISANQLISFSTTSFGANVVQSISIFYILVYNYVCCTKADAKLMKNHELRRLANLVEETFNSVNSLRSFGGFFLLRHLRFLPGKGWIL